jgi:protease-4
MKQLLLLGILASFTSGCAVINIPLTLSRDAALEEFEVKAAKGRFVTDKILLLDISGVISGESSSGLLGSQSNTVSNVRDALDKARRDSDIKAIILRINSPGGEVTASDIIYEQIRRYRKDRADKNKPVPVLASMLGEGASGGYYAAVAADEIYAHPTCVTGSIGVTAMFPRLEELGRKIGVEVRIIRSADKKDIGSMWRDFTPEERKILQGMIDELYERFIEIVAENRPQLDRDSVRRLADGRIYTAQQALQHRLIDGIAYLDDVIETAKKKAGIDDAQVIVYKRTSRFKGGIYSQAPGGPPHAAPQINLLQINADGLLGPWANAGFYYLWMP